MLDTKLILIEGLPGAGKTTTSIHLGKNLQEAGIPCNWYLEEDVGHPIDCVDFKIKDLQEKLPLLWEAFVERARQNQTVTVIESRLWQNTALFMLMAEYPVEEIMRLHQQVWQVLAPLSPVLLYLYEGDVEGALRRTYKSRGEARMATEFENTNRYPWFQSRGLYDHAGWVQFFQEWLLVAEELFEDWPYHKTKIENPHEDWGRTYQKLQRFLEVAHLPYFTTLNLNI